MGYHRVPTAGHTGIVRPTSPDTTGGRPRAVRKRRPKVVPAPNLRHLGIVDLGGDSPEMAGESLELTLGTIKKSAGIRRTLLLTYIDRSGQRTEREIEPYKLERKNGKLILWGWCRMRDGIRMFEIERMRGLRQGEAEFEPRFEVEIESPDGNSEENEREDTDQTN